MGALTGCPALHWWPLALPTLPAALGRLTGTGRGGSAVRWGPCGPAWVFPNSTRRALSRCTLPAGPLERQSPAGCGQESSRSPDLGCPVQLAGTQGRFPVWLAPLSQPVSPHLPYNLLSCLHSPAQVLRLSLPPCPRETLPDHRKTLCSHPGARFLPGPWKGPSQAPGVGGLLPVRMARSLPSGVNYWENS